MRDNKNYKFSKTRTKREGGIYINMILRQEKRVRGINLQSQSFATIATLKPKQHTLYPIHSYNGKGSGNSKVFLNTRMKIKTQSTKNETDRDLFKSK